MAGISERFKTFLSNLQLSEAQLQDAITKHTSVRRALHNAYYTTTFIKSTTSATPLSTIEETFQIKEYIQAYKSNEIALDDSTVYRTSLLVGSYGKNTEITPPSDIDILFEMPSDLYSRYDAYTYNGQSQLLQDIKKVLLKTFSRTDIKGDGPIVSVPFQSYKIEVLPAFRLQEGGYYYPDTQNGGSWKQTNPKAGKDYLTASNKRSNGNTVRLIKMLKAWKLECNVPILSFALELAAINFLEGWEYFDKSSVYYDWMMRDFFRYLLSFVNSSFSIPGLNERLSLGENWKSKVETALARSQKACEYESQSKDSDAAIEWKKIFGSRYYF